MTTRFIRTFAATTLLLASGVAGATTITFGYVAEVTDIDGSAAMIQVLADAGIFNGTDARGTVAISDENDRTRAVGVHTGAVTDFTLSLAGVAASFDGSFNDVFVQDDDTDILLATGAMTYGNTGLTQGLVGFQLRDSTGSAWDSTDIPFSNPFELIDFDTYAPFDLETTGLLFSVEFGNELAFVFAEIKHLDAKIVPLPAAVWMFGFALLSLAGISRKR